MNETELEFDIGLNAIRRQLLIFKSRKDAKSFRRLRISCLFFEALAIFALEEHEITEDYYKELKDQLRKVYNEVESIKKGIQKEWNVL